VCVYSYVKCTPNYVFIGYLQELTQNNFELRCEDNSVGIVTSAVGWTKDRETSLVSRGFRQAL